MHRIGQVLSHVSSVSVKYSFWPLESSSAVLVMIRSKSISVCNHSLARLVDSSRNRTFSRVTQIDALVRRTP